MSTDAKLMNFRIVGSDRTLLDRISQHYYDASMSAVLRRLIRQEAKRIGISFDDDAPEEVIPELELQT